MTRLKVLREGKDVEEEARVAFFKRLRASNNVISVLQVVLGLSPCATDHLRSDPSAGAAIRPL